MNETLKTFLGLGSLVTVILGLSIGLPMLVATTNIANAPASGVTVVNESVTGYLDSTNLGYVQVHYYEINTPDGAVPCLVTEPTAGYGDSNPSLDCDWSVIR